MDRSTDTTAHRHNDRIARAAWFCAFVLPLALATLLLGVKSAQAALPGPEAAPLAFEEEFEFEAEGEEDEAQLEAELAQEECEFAEEEAAEGEIGQAEADEICREAAELANPGSHPDPGTAGRHHHHPHHRHHKHGHPKACRHAPDGRRSHCPRRSPHR